MFSEEWLWGSETPFVHENFIFENTSWLFFTYSVLHIAKPAWSLDCNLRPLNSGSQVWSIHTESENLIAA